MYTKKLEHCERREIVLNHNAFGYLGNEYKFTSHTLTGLSPEEQVSAKKMKEITDLVKKEGIKIIFFESFVSDKISRTIAKETGAKVDSLQPLSNVTKEEASKGYIALMQENLEKLTLAMECK
ncbi:zinc ABC transporter substrate-binding protein [Sulfurimonas sp. MAG313]|nr:zinc ABC transporter substrate-binding protein [Sulfurimonas sp. MAG313]MDF1881083.1 zinc ABC transporter substrate-binding protein [Sulfurimonas sp. MAG313]